MTNLAVFTKSSDWVSDTWMHIRSALVQRTRPWFAKESNERTAEQFTLSTVALVAACRGNLRRGRSCSQPRLSQLGGHGAVVHLSRCRRFGGSSLDVASKNLKRLETPTNAVAPGAAVWVVHESEQ
jgi:hypothetical protein